MSIDGLTIMINVNRKKTKKPPLSSRQRAQARTASLLAAVARRAGCAATEGSGSTQGRDGAGQQAALPPPTGPRLGPFLPRWILITEMQDSEPNSKSNPCAACCPCYVPGPTEAGHSWSSAGSIAAARP